MTAPNLREAAQMALEALEGVYNWSAPVCAHPQLDALRAALALPDAEPVGYRYKDSESMVRAMPGYKPGPGWSPLYAAFQPAPVERKPLTDEEILAIGKAIGNRVDAYDDGIEFARAILAADRGAA